jgi:hypothetical protein
LSSTTRTIPRPDNSLGFTEPIANLAVFEGEHEGWIGSEVAVNARAAQPSPCPFPQRATGPGFPSMNKKLILLAVLAFVPAIFAQENAAKLGLAREAIAAMQADKMFDGMAAQMKQMAAHYAQMPGDATPEARQKSEALQSKIMDLSMSEAKSLIAKMDTVYASVYSEGELKAMVAFFKSPEGQSMIAKQPQIMAQMMPLVQEMQQGLMPKIQKLVEEAKAPAPATP